MTDESIFLGTTGAQVIQLPRHDDARGALVVAEGAANLPFVPARFFLVHSVPPGETRGGHAVENCDELLIAVAGSLRVGIDDGGEEHFATLNSPDRVLYLPRGIYCWQQDFSADAVLLVLASTTFAETRYQSDRAAYRLSKAAAKQSRGES